MGIDLAKYRDDNPDYFGGSTLADVAADLHERSGAAATGETLDQFNRRYGFDGQIAAEAKPRGEGGFGLLEGSPTAGDYVRSLGIGLDQFGQVLGRGMQWAGLDRAGKAIEGVYKEREAATRAAQSEGYKAEMDKPFTEKRTDGSGLFGYGLGPGATSPTKILGTIVESAPSMAAAGGPSVAMTRGLIGLGVRPGVAGIVGSAFGEGGIGGLFAAKEGEDQILDAPDDVLRQHPDYQAALAGQPADMPEEARHAAAKASVARSEALRSGLLVGGTTALLGAPSGHFLGKSVGGETGKTLLRTMGKQGALEAVQEASQNAVERVIHNQAAQKYINPDQDLMEGVVEETAGGAITGGVMGFGMGGAAHDGASLRFRRDFTAESGKALANGSVAQLADADLDRAYLVADGLYRENPEDGVRQVLLGLGAEQRRRQNEARGFPLNEILADEEAARQAALAGPEASGEPAAGAAPETPAGPDRAAELATLSKRQLNDLAGGLGIQAPGRIKRDALVAAVLQAEEAARAWNEPDAVEARYREAHAAPFPGRLDDFLFQAAPAPLVAPEAAPQTPAPAMETPAEPDRAASLAGLPFTRLKTMAVSLGIERPGRMRRDALVPAIVAAEEQARRYYDPENIQARYQEEHAAPFPTRQDAFLDRAAPTGRRPRSRYLAPAAPEILPTGEVPLVEAGTEPAGPAAQAPTEQPTSRPALVEQTPEGALPTGEVPLVEAGRPAETFPTPEAESAAPATPTSEDLAALSRRRLNDLAATLGLERPGAVRREDLVGRIGAARQELVAARPQTAQERPWLRETGEKATVGALLRADDMMVARKPVEGQVVHFEVPGLEDVGFVAHPDLQDGKGWTVTETQSGTAVAVGVPTREEALRGVYDRLAGFDAARFLANRDELVAKWGSAVQEPADHSGGNGREPVAQATQVAPPAAPQAPRYAMTLRETTHAKRGHPLYVVTLDERTSREAYEGLKKEFTKLGGYWSRYKGRGAIPGVQFEDKAKAEAFVARFGKKPAIQDKPPANAGTSAKESGRWPERAAQPADHAQEQSLGVNRDGREVFEDERGNRFVREGRVRLEAPVPVRPTRAGVAAEPRTPEELHRDEEHEFLTREELAAFGAPETSTQAREGLNSPKEAQGARDDDAHTHPDRSRSDVGLEGPSDLAPGEPAPGDLGSVPDESGRPEGSHRPENAPVGQRPVSSQSSEPSGGRDSGGDAGRGRAGGRPGPERGKSARTPDKPAGAADLGVVGGPAAPEGDRAPGRDVSRDRNHRIAPDDVLVPGGNATRAKANQAAVRLLKELEAGNRLPTPQERKVLAQFSGWGSLAEEVFKADFENLANRYGGEVPASVRHSYPAALLDKYDAWRRRYGELHPNIGGLFTKEEWDAAKRSTLNAHYTDREVIAAMWDMVRRLGFAGGQVVEPAAGIGHFLGLMPEDLAQASTLKGVELDSVTGRLLGKLYPAADIQVTGFQDARRMGNNMADLVISNVPFGDFPVSDKAHKDYSGWSIHNYFLARAVDVVRPGGLVAAITSHFSMDTTRWGRIREYLAGKADLVGAIRLPGTAFAKNAGTEVTTDILILRKKDGQAFEGQPWRQVEKVETPEGEAGVNEYFVSHPDMVLGRHSLTGSMHGGLEYTVLPDKGRPLAEQLREAGSRLPADVMGQGAAVAAKPLSEALDERADAGMREGTLVLRDGEVFSVEDGRLTRPEWREGKLAESRAAIARQYVGVKAAAKDLVRTMLSEEATDAAIAARQQALGRLYDAFVKKHGPFLDNRKLIFLRDDIEYPNVLALEKKEERAVDGDKQMVVAKADIFTKRTIRPFAEPKTAASAEDAVKISLLYRGRVDAAKVGELLGVPAVEARRRLLESGAALENPETGLLETPQEYLSGNVRQKLQIARDSAASNPDYKRNVDALEAVQPPTKPISRIDARLGATWIPDTVVSAFMEHMGVRWGRAVQTRTRAGEDGMSSWDVRGSLTQEAQNRWSVGDTDLLDILQDSLNLKLAKAYKYLPDGKGGRERVVDQEGTLLVQEKQKALQEEFLKFTRETPKIATELEALYDDRFGGQIPRQYNVPDVDHYPGAVETISLRDHQKRGVSRGLQENTLFAHGVGAGKTYLVTTLAMEARRLGTAKKPMIVVQGATLEQFAGAFKRLYPAANVLAPNADDRTRANRQRLLSQIATGDWDAVIVPHSFFNGLAISPERESAFIEEDLDALRADLRVAEADTSQERGRKSTRVKQIEKMILKREERLKKLLDARKDENVFFEDTGVDMLVVDEAHAYKRGDFVTKMDNVKGLDRDSSQRSMQLLLKSRYIAEKTGGKNVHLATGTPVSNTLAELWTALRYIRPDLLERFNVTQFDDFASTFCATKTDIEETATGDFKPVTRFNRYQNIGELIAMWKAGADIVLAEDLDYIQDIPKLKGGRPQEVSLERNPELTGYIQFLKQWRTEWERLTGKEKREQSHVPLLIYNLAQKAALDLRLVNPELEEAPGGKLDAAAAEIFNRYEAHQDTRAAQAVFSDIYQSSDKTFNIWKELKRKLVAKGIPAKEIAIIYDFNEKAREKLFAGVNAGEVRVVMGSTEKLGVGVNIQERLVALHHLAPPVRPMDWEQRNGRIRRQGNRFEEVEILAYGVKNTLDSVSFNILQNKQKFINQLLRGEIDGDVLENPFDDVQLSFEDMMAAFSGNPLAMERVKLEGQVRDLGRLRQAFQDEKAGRIRQLDLLRESRIPAIEASLAAAEKEVNRLQRAFPDLKAESFTLKDGTFDRKAFTKRLTDWYDGIKERLEQETVGKTVAHYEGMRAKLGGSVAFETGGHAVEITVRPVPSSVVGTDSNRSDGLANVTEAGLSGSFTVKTKDGKTLFERNFGAPGGFVRAFNNGLEEAVREPERIQDQLARARESAASLERLVEEKFTREDEYREASARLREVEEELKKAKNEDLAVADSGENAGEKGATSEAIRLMRSEERPAGAPSPAARAVAEELRQGLRQVPALRGIVDIYEREADLPADLRREVEAAGVSGRFYGAYDPESGRIVLVAGNIPHAKAAQTAFVQTLLRHEGRHGGLDMVLGGRETRQAFMLQAARIMPKEVSRWLTRHGLDSTRETRAEAAEELLVSWAKDGTVHRALDRLLARIAQWVRTIFPNLRLTKAELRTLLAQADDFVDGKGLDFVAPLGRPLTAAPAFAREEAPQWSEQIEAFLGGRMRPHEILEVGETPPIVGLLGGHDLPLVMTQAKANKILRTEEKGGKHGVSPEVLKQLPQALERPVVVLESATLGGSLVVVTALPHQDSFLVAAVHLNVRQGRAEINEVASVYAKDAGPRWVAQQIRDGLLLYRDKTKIPGWQRSFGLQLPTEMPTRDKRKIFTQVDLVKYEQALPAKGSGPRFARNGDLTGVPEEKRNVGRWFKDEVAANVRSVLPAVRGALQETAALGKILRSPEYWKHPVLKALYETFRDRTDTAHELLHKALAAGDAGDDSGRTILDQAKEALKDPKQRAILSEGVDHADVNEIAPEDMETWFADHGAAEDTVRLWRTMRERYDMLLEERLAATRRLMDKARDAYGRKIVRRLIEAGIAAADAKTFDAAAYNGDKTLSEALAPYASKVAGVVAAARKAGITIKDQLADVRIKGEDGASFSLRELVEHMGRLRGFYAPRLREVGEYVVRGQRTGADGKVERFRAHKEWRAGAEKLRGQMERAGWDMEPVGKVEKLPEATQGIIKTLELAKTVESAVNQVGEDVDAGLVQELLETLADEVKARGFRSQSIRRTGRHGDVVQGYFKDAVERFTRYVGQTAYGLAKMEAAGKAARVLFGQDGGPGIDIRKEPAVYRLAVDYLSENLRNPEAGDRVFALAKSVASLKYLGLNPRSALVNLSSMATSVPAALHAYAMQGKGGFARVGREIARSMTDYLGVMTGKWGSFTADEKRLLEAVRKESLDDPQFIREALSTYRDTAGKSWSWLMGKSLALFGATERLNRGSTILAGYRLARAMGADHDTAVTRAREASDRAHGVYDRATQPAWTWGTGAGARVGQSWYVYKKYGHNYLQLVHELFAKRDWQAATFALAAPMVLGGLGSQVLVSLAKALFAVGGGDDPEKWVYERIRKNLGGEAEELARFGLLGLATGTDMSGSIGTMIDMPGTWYDILGPMGGLARDVLTGIGYFAAGQPGRGAEKVLPASVSKILQAARESAQGVTTSKNFPVVGEDGKRLIPSAGESVAKGLGFRPVREAASRARTSEAIEEEKTWGERRDRIYSRFRAFALDGGRDAAERRALVEAVGEYNRDLAVAGLSGRVAPITRESLLRQAERVAEPTKREKARLGQGTASARAVESLSGEDIEDLSHPFYQMRRTYAATRERYDALRQVGDLEGAARLRAETRLPLLRRLVGGVTAVHDEMAKVRHSVLPQEVKERRLEVLRQRERLAMDRVARFGTSLAVNE